MTKTLFLNKKRIILISVLLVLISGVVLGFHFKTQFLNLFAVKKLPEVFTLTAVILSVDAENNTLTIKPSNQEPAAITAQEFKVIVSKTTQLIKLEVPFAKDNLPPPGTQFTPTRREISLQDFKQGDEVFIRSSGNIHGKNKIDNVELIQILP